jgi:hypothetical protein
MMSSGAWIEQGARACLPGTWDVTRAITSKRLVSDHWSWHGHGTHAETTRALEAVFKYSSRCGTEAISYA